MEFGLSEKEAKVYVALLSLEVAGANEIAKKAGINRSSTYVVIGSLKRRGLVSMSPDKRVQQYVAATPEVLIDQAKAEKDRSTDIENEIEELMPRMLALHKETKHRPKVMFFEGSDGLIKGFEDVFKSKEKMMRVYSNPANLSGLIGDYLSTFVQRRLKAGIKMHGIHPDSTFHEKMMREHPNTLDKYALVPKEKYNFKADIAIYDNKIGYMSGDNQGIAIIIESKEMTEVMKSIFDMAFEEATRVKKNKK